MPRQDDRRSPATAAVGPVDDCDICRGCRVALAAVVGVVTADVAEGRGLLPGRQARHPLHGCL